MGPLHRDRPHLRVLQRVLPALVTDLVAGEQQLHALERVLEQVEALLRRRERDAERVMLGVEPRRAQRQLEAAV